MSEHVFSFLENAGARWKDHVAVESALERRTFGDLLQEAGNFSKALKDKCDPEGKGLGFVCRNNSRFVSGLFGCSAAGAVTMPVLPGTRESEIEMLLFQSGIAFLVSEKESSFHFIGEVDKEELNEHFDLYIFHAINPQPIAMIFPGAVFIRPSSGTTGKSKGVVISHKAAFERTEAANEGLGLDESTGMLWVMPMAFHFVVSILLYVRYGCRLIVCDDFIAASLILTANRYAATHLYASPLHYRLLANHPGEERFHSLKMAVSTSAGLEQAIADTFLARYAIPVAQAYGIIEIGLPLLNSGAGLQKPGSIGKPLPSYEVAILDSRYEPVGTGNAGAFAIRGPGMFSGYLWPLVKAADVMEHGWFMTGDIAMQDNQGYVFIKGRSKSMINVSGNKVFPEEVEGVLLLHPDVVEARVYRGSHPLTGELVEAEVVAKGKEINTEDIIAFCHLHLPPYKIPQRIFFVEEIGKTPTGKISRS